MLLGRHIEMVDIILNRIYHVNPDHMMGKDDDDLVFVMDCKDDPDKHNEAERLVAVNLKDAARHVSFEFNI